MAENGKPKADGLNRWLIIDTILSVIFMLYFSSVVLNIGFGDMAGIAITFLVIWFLLISLCARLLYTSWALKKKGENTGSKIRSIIAFVISAILLILGILFKYY